MVTIEAVPTEIHVAVTWNATTSGGGSAIDLDWRATNPGAGLATCTLQYRMDKGDWQLHSGQCAGAETSNI